jgi:hypothetical protein
MGVLMDARDAWPCFLLSLLMRSGRGLARPSRDETNGMGRPYLFFSFLALFVVAICHA